MSTVVRMLPRDDFAIQNHIAGKPTQRSNEFRKRCRHFVQRAREQPHLSLPHRANRGRGGDPGSATAMRLRANAVVLVFDLSVLEILKRFLGVGRRTGQHEPDGMKQPHVRFVEAVLGGKSQRRSDVAEQHVGALHFW